MSTRDLYNTRLALQLGVGTLRSRPTLSALGVILLALAVAVIGGLLGTVYLLRALQTELLSALNVELELVQDSEEARRAVMTRAEAWPFAEFVQYVPPEATLRELQRETGENLLALFGTNPFPPLVRVRFAAASLETLDSLSLVAEQWPEVAQVVYPRSVWSDLERLRARLRSGVAMLATGIALLSLGLVGLCLRAQVRNRADTWEFLMLMGVSQQTLSLSVLMQEAAVGLLGGIAASAVLAVLASVYGWLFLREVSFPFWFYVSTSLAAIVLCVLAGVLTPRRFMSRAT